MNEPAIRTEEQIISLFPDRETQVCRGWVLKRMEGQLLVYPLYYKFSEGDIPENIRRCEEIGRQCGARCVFRIVEHTNYHLSSILTDNGYGLEKCGVVGEWNLTGDAGKLCMKRKMPEVVGADVYDRTGNGHLGIIEFPVPILKGNVEVIKSIREKLYEPEFSDLTVVDFSDLAQGCKTYDEFIEKMKDVSETKLNYFGIAICGAKKKVNKLTGSMALLR